MNANQTTTTNHRTPSAILADIHTMKDATIAPSARVKQETTDRLNALMEKRNDLIKALEISPDLFANDLTETINTLCETIAQIAVYKTLLKLSDGSKDISTSGADMCAKLYRSFVNDMRLYNTHSTDETYSDAMDLFNVAYMDIWQYLNSTAPLALDDTVLTVTLKNGNEKNYTIFQTACKSIRDSIRTWSKSDNFKKLHYIIGIADNGAQVTTSKRPQDDLTDIDESKRKAFFDRYGLTAQQQDILHLVINGESASTIANLLNIPLRTVQDNIKKAKAKFATASAYAEYMTAKSAEKTARAKAEKHPDDTVYQAIYARAQARTAQALTAWKTAFHKEV